MRGSRCRIYVSYEFDAHELKARLDALGLQQVLFNMPVPDFASGGKGLLILPDRVSEFRESVRTAIDYARVLGIGQVNCLGADSCWRGPGFAAQTAVENLRFAAGEMGPMA